MVLKFYFDIMSQPSRALLLFLRANSIPYEEIPISLREGAQHSDDFAAITPFKKVPVIDHDGFVLTESVAILKYLCRTFTVPNNWYPQQDDSKRIAKIDEYMSWQHLGIRTAGSTYFFNVILMPILKGEPPDEKKISRLSRNLENTLNQIENIFLKDSQYIAGDNLTIADLLAVTELEQAGMADFNIKEGRPNLAAYMELVRSRLQPHYDQIHSNAKKMVEKLRNPSKL